MPAPGRIAPGLRQRAEGLAAPLPPLLVAAERVAATVAQGVHGRRRVGTGETFWQFRRYQGGDPSTAVDWRQSAKRQSLFIRQNEWEAAESVWLWRDASPSMHYRSQLADTEKYERASLILLALASLLIRGGERVALLGDGNLPTTGRATLDRLAVSLLLSGHAKGNQSLPPRADLPRFAQIVVIGDFLSPTDEIVALVRAYAGSGVIGHLLQVRDPAEEDMPFIGRTRFEGLEGEGSYLVGRADALREAYLGRVRRHHEALVALCNSVGWTFSAHRTDRPAQTALLALYSSLSGGITW
ncbi:MAG TPA: DUF58 domain-containing protein [Candidatus Cybelea sp.]|nr:DUF58 domain-containing protein [Candidatus Cybelea sp.]